VAGQEAFIADTPEEAWAWARTNHPEDNGAFVQYVIPEKGPRIYANRRKEASIQVDHVLAAMIRVAEQSLVNGIDHEIE
jgi:hypothetical protein